MKTGGIDVRASGPLIHLRLEGSASEVAREAARDELEKLLARGERHGLVVDLRDASLAGLGGSRALLELFRRERARVAKDCAGVAVVVRGRATKAVLAALAGLAPRAVPLEVFPHAMAAEAWVRERLAAARV